MSSGWFAGVTAAPVPFHNAVSFNARMRRTVIGPHRTVLSTATHARARPEIVNVYVPDTAAGSDRFAVFDTVSVRFAITVSARNTPVGPVRACCFTSALRRLRLISIVRDPATTVPVTVWSIPVETADVSVNVIVFDVCD